MTTQEKKNRTRSEREHLLIELQFAYRDLLQSMRSVQGDLRLIASVSTQEARGVAKASADRLAKVIIEHARQSEHLIRGELS